MGILNWLVSEALFGKGGGVLMSKELPYVQTGWCAFKASIWLLWDHLNPSLRNGYEWESVESKSMTITLKWFCHSSSCILVQNGSWGEAPEQLSLTPSPPSHTLPLLQHSWAVPNPLPKPRPQTKGVLPSFHGSFTTETFGWVALWGWRRGYVCQLWYCCVIPTDIKIWSARNWTKTDTRPFIAYSFGSH